MSNSLHPQVLAHIEKLRADAELKTERLHSARKGINTLSTGGANRAIDIGKRIREAEGIAASWRLVLAAVLADQADVDDAETVWPAEGSGFTGLDTPDAE